MDWFRSYHGAPTDPKWLSIARRAKVLPGQVASVVWAMFDYASQHEEDRGSIAGFDAEAICDFFGYEPKDVEAIIAALRDKRIITGDRFTAWDKRQPKREDPTAADRKRAQREREKAAKSGGEPPTGSDDAEPPPAPSGHEDQSRHVTPCHTASRDVTLDKRRVEEIRDPHPLTPSPAVRRASAEARAVVAVFKKAKDARWPEAIDRIAPEMTMETLAQQHLDAGGTVDLLTEVIERAIRDWKSPAPPRSLSALESTIVGRVAEFVRAGKPPQSTRATSAQTEHIVPDRDSLTRQRLRTFRRTGDWLWPGDPRPDSPRCQIDRALLREEMGDEFMARFHPSASLPTPTHEAHHA